MTNSTTTMQVFRIDLEELLDKYPLPQKHALRLALKDLKVACPHPESQRTYMLAEFSLESPEKGVNQNRKVRNVPAFHCDQCHAWIVPEQREEE